MGLGARALSAREQVLKRTARHHRVLLVTRAGRQAGRKTKVSSIYFFLPGGYRSPEHHFHLRTSRHVLPLYGRKQPFQFCTGVIFSLLLLLLIIPKAKKRAFKTLLLEQCTCASVPHRAARACRSDSQRHTRFLFLQPHIFFLALFVFEQERFLPFTSLSCWRLRFKM